MFTSIAIQLGRSEAASASVREEIVSHLATKPEVVSVLA
jgi:hypothetical protein